MDDTRAVRLKLMDLWEKMGRGEISQQEARSHIGFGRAIMDTMKVEVAVAHLNVAELPSVPLGKRSSARLRRSS